MLKAIDEFDRFQSLTEKRQNELTGVFKFALGIPPKATVEFYKTRGGSLVVGAGADNEHSALRADVTMPGEDNSHVVEIYLSARRLNKFFIDDRPIPRTSEQGVAGAIMEKLSKVKTADGHNGEIAVVASHPKNGNFYFVTSVKAEYKDPKYPPGVMNEGVKFQLFEVNSKGGCKEIELSPKSKKVFPEQEAKFDLQTSQGTFSFPNGRRGEVKFGNTVLFKQRMGSAL